MLSGFFSSLWFRPDFMAWPDSKRVQLSLVFAALALDLGLQVWAQQWEIWTLLFSALGGLAILLFPARLGCAMAGVGCVQALGSYLLFLVGSQYLESINPTLATAPGWLWQLYCALCQLALIVFYIRWPKPKKAVA